MTSEAPAEELTPSARNAIKLNLLEQNVRDLKKRVETNTELLTDLTELLTSIRHIVAFVLVVAQIFGAIGIIFYPVRWLVEYLKGS